MHRFMAILSVEWKGAIVSSCKSEITLVFSRNVLTKALGVCRARDIMAIFARRMDLWDWGLHTGLMWDM